MSDKKKGKDEAAPEGEAEGVEGGGKKKPPIIIIAAAAAVLVLGGGGAGAFFLMKKPAAAEGGKEAGHGKKTEKKDEKKKEEHAGGKGQAGVTMASGPDGVTFYGLPSMTVNMQTADGRPSYLKLKLTLELADESVADQLNENLPRLTDMFQLFLRELRPEDLSGSQGGYQLRMELLRRVNLVVAPAKVNSVLIEEMLIN